LLTALAPVLEGVELKTSVKMMNATFFPGQNPGFARQFPNPEADAIWEKFELLRTIPITKEDVIGLEKILRRLLSLTMNIGVLGIMLIWLKLMSSISESKILLSVAHQALIL
jgi:hypothetical protein